MNPIDIIIIIAAVAIVGSFVGIAIWRKKNGQEQGLWLWLRLRQLLGLPVGEKR